MNRCPITKIFGAENYRFITMWHVINLYSDNIYFLEKENVIVIKTEKEDTVNIIDVIFSDTFDLDKILPNIIESGSIKNIKLYFPPDELKFEYDEIFTENTRLFIRGDWELSNTKFKFPETAIT